MLIGLVCHLLNGGLNGLFFSMIGLLLGIALFSLPYLFGGMGAGDVKLMGAVGSLLGPKGVFMAFIFTAIIGGIYAIVILTLHGLLKETFKRYWMILKTFILTQKFIYTPPSEKKNKPRLYYGVAIALGTLISIAFFQKLV